MATTDVEQSRIQYFLTHCCEGILKFWRCNAQRKMDCEENAKGMQMQMQMRDAVRCTTETVGMQFRLWYRYVPEGQAQPTLFFPPGSGAAGLGDG